MKLLCFALVGMLLLSGCFPETRVVHLSDEITRSCYITCHTLQNMSCDEALELYNLDETIGSQMAEDNCTTHHNLEIKQGVRLI